MSRHKDLLGERMKRFESLSDQRLMDLLPVYARIDGRKFSKYTKGFDKPFDKRMSSSMEGVTKYLVEKTHADFGYTQSDEISLFWENEKPIENFMFGGRVIKLSSVLSGMASSYFMKQAIESDMPTDSIPHFDARVCQMPNKVELYNMLVWRQKDCIKNAITSQAHSIFGHRALHKKNDLEKRQMILENLGKSNINDVIENRYLNGVSVFKEVYKNENLDIRSRIVPCGTSLVFSDYMKSKHEEVRLNATDIFDYDFSYENAFSIIKEGLKK